MNDEEEANVKECEHCSGDGFEPMTGKWRESHACRVCGGDGEVASSIEGTSSPQPTAPATMHLSTIPHTETIPRRT